MSTENFDKTQTKVFLPIIVGLAIALGMFLGKKLDPFEHTNQSAAISAVNRSPGKVEEILRYIEARYVEDIDNQALSDEAIRAIIGDLDPHSAYHTAEEVKAMSEGMRVQISDNCTSRNGRWTFP